MNEDRKKRSRGSLTAEGHLVHGTAPLRCPVREGVEVRVFVLPDPVPELEKPEQNPANQELTPVEEIKTQRKASGLYSM